LPWRRGADDQHGDLLGALVAELEGGLGFDCGDRAARELDPLGRVAEHQRGGAFENDEDLVLNVLKVARAARAGRQAPDIGAHVLQRLRDGHDSATLVAALRRAKLDLVRAKDRVSHGRSLVMRVGDREGN
jgi:hypothetical protein